MTMLCHYSCRKLLLQDEHQSPPVLLSSTTTNSTSDNQPQINSPFDSSMALTILVLLTAIFFMAFFSVYIRRFSDDSSDFRSRRQSSTTTPTASSSSFRLTPPKCNHKSSAVGSLPLISYSGGASHQIHCIICLNEFHEEENVKIIPCCRHVFHPDCIDKWLVSHVSCPLCRSTKMDVVPEVFLGVGTEMQGSSETLDDSRRRRWTVDESDTLRNDDVVVDIRRTRSLSNLGSCTCIALHRSRSF